MDWLNQEMMKDQNLVELEKLKTIQEIKSIDKSKMFVVPPKKKVSLLTKILTVLGYGKKG